MLLPYAESVRRRRRELETALDRFVSAARSLADVRAMYVFGSFGRDEIGPRSDLDLLVVRETRLRGPARAEDLVVAALPGIECDIVVLTPAEYAAGPTSPFWRDVFASARCVYAA